MSELVLERAPGTAPAQPNDMLELRDSLEALSPSYARRAGKVAVVQMEAGLDEASTEPGLESTSAAQTCVEVFDEVMRTRENIVGDFEYYFNAQHAEAYRRILVQLAEQAGRKEGGRTQITVNNGSGEYINGKLCGRPIPKTGPHAPYTIAITLKDRDGTIRTCEVLPGAITVHELDNAA